MASKSEERGGSMSFKLEITGDNKEKIEAFLKALCEKNEMLKKYGYEIYYTKENDKFYFFCITKGLNLALALGGKKTIIKEMEKRLKECCGNLQIKEVKVD